MTDTHPNDLVDYAYELGEVVKDMQEHIEADDLPRAQKCVSDASKLLSRIMVGVLDLHLQRQK